MKMKKKCVSIALSGRAIYETAERPQPVTIAQQGNIDSMEDRLLSDALVSLPIGSLELQPSRLFPTRLLVHVDIDGIVSSLSSGPAPCHASLTMRALFENDS